LNCSSCGRGNPEGARFCAYCGTSLEPARPASAGERKYATVVFADVAGSTALSERLDPEDWAEIMNGAFAFLNASVTSYGGTVGRLMGDAILAFFGAPDALEEHAVRAVHAALAMQAAADSYGATIRSQYGLEFHIRVGIATGHLVYASVGDAAKAEYTAMGDTANVAARLQSLATPGSVLVDAETEALTRPAFEFDQLGASQLKGKAEPVEVYRVVAPRLRGSAGEVAAPLVGREAEVEMLVAQIRAGTSGAGGAVLVVGEAGVGKSRLLAEVLRNADPLGEGPRWVEGRAVSYGQAATYHAWRGAIRALLGLGETTAGAGPGDQDERQRVGEALTKLAIGETHARILEHLAGFEVKVAFDTQSQPGEVAPAEEGRADAVAEAVRALLLAVANESPFVLALEDLHWADGASVDLLVAVADTVRDAPLTMVVAMRPERSVPAERIEVRLRATLGDAFEFVQLAPLDGSQADALLAQLPAAAALPDETRARIVRKSDGNPYFLEEIVRDLIDSGRLVHDGQAWTAAGGIEDVHIPDTLLGVLTSRIDRLPKDAKHVAQTASVIGRTFAAPVLTGMYAVAPEGDRVGAIEPHLATLSREELVRELDARSSGIYRFKHALSQEAAYASLLHRRRRELHRRTLDVLETLYGDGSDVHAAELAFHALRAEDWDRAARWSDVAAHGAMQVYALHDALEHATNAIESLERLDDPDAERIVRATLDWVDVSVRALQHEQPGPRQALLGRVERAESIARALGHDDLLARVLVHKGNVLMLSGFPGTAYASLEEASNISLDLEQEPLFLLPFFVATERMVDRDPRQAALKMQEIIALAKRHGNRGFQAHAQAARALALARLGNEAEARAEVENALTLGPTSGSRIKEADVNIVAAIVYLELGDLARAEELSELGAGQALNAGGMECACAGYFAHGMTQLTIDRLPEASRAFRRSVEVGGNHSMKTFVNLSEAGAALTRLKNGDDRAVAELEAALANAASLQDAYGTAMLQRILGEHYLAAGEQGRAADLLHGAARYYRSAGMTPSLVSVVPTAVEALERSGDVAKANELRDWLDPERPDSDRPASRPPDL